MSRAFQVDDRVKYIGASADTVLSKNERQLMTGAVLPLGTSGVVVAASGFTLPGYVTVDFEVKPSHHSRGLWQCRPEWLKLIYDGDEKVSWSSCVWQPKEVRV